MKKLTLPYLSLLLLLLAACDNRGGSGEQTPVAAAPTATVTAEPTPIPTDTPVPPTPTPEPTDTPVPPTATPEPTATETPEALDPIVISDMLAADNCPIIELNTDAWQPLFAAFKGGNDPFYHIHTNEDAFYFNLELYTAFGAGWTGQTGLFTADCNGSGLCVYIVPDGQNPYLASAGEIDIVSLSQEGGTLARPVDITLTNLTMNPVPGSGAPGCYHIDKVTVLIEENP